MSSGWPALPYEVWQPTRDTLHAHTQVLGKLAVALAPREPQLQHTALRLTARGWETQPLPAPDGSGSFVVALDLRTYEAFVEHTDGRGKRIPLTPDRAVGEVTREVLAAVRELAGPVAIKPAPQETAWKTPLDEDDEHASFDRAQIDAYFTAATRAAQVLAELRAPYRGRSTPVNAWWGAFDLSVGLFSGRPVTPPSDDFLMRNAGDAEQVAVGWWPGDARYPRAAFFGYAFPAPEGLADATLAPATGHWDAALGEFILDWDDVRELPDPHGAALEFARSVVRHGCEACAWDPELAASAEGVLAPMR
ncbi:MAG: hypothetical protein QOD52_770 [Gaiellaceae bacterium]|nr:hypothetical protein [Gaiellaceae bacterium]